MSVFNYIDIKKFKWIFEMIVVFLIGIGIYIFQKFFLTKYDYALIDSYLIFKKVIGKKETVLFDVDIGNIEAVYKYEEFLKSENDIKKISNLAGFSKSKLYVLIWKSGDQKYALKFCPSDEFYNMLSNKIKFNNKQKDSLIQTVFYFVYIFCNCFRLLGII